MNEKEKREYQTVILGALLHDVGKFIVRPYGRRYLKMLAIILSQQISRFL